jgi:hypothetical protein
MSVPVFASVVSVCVEVTVEHVGTAELLKEVTT